MKKTMKAVVAAVFALTSTFAMTSAASASAPSVKNNDKCLKTQYGKSTKTGTTTFKCRYNTTTKKYVWSKVAAAAKATPVIDLAKLDKTGWPKEFIIGGVPAENVATMQTKWSGLIKLLETELGVPVKFYSATSYAGVIEASIAAKVDMVAWGAMSYIISKLNKAKIDLMGITEYVDGTKTYTAQLLVPKTSSITGIKDLKDKTVCFVSATSTSGNLIPLEGILAAGLKMSDMTAKYPGKHDTSVLGLVNGTGCEASFAQDATVSALGTGVLAGMNKDDYKVVWTSAGIPNGPWTIRSTLPASFKAAVKNIMLTKLNKEYFTSKGYNGCTSVADCVIVEDAKTARWVSVADTYYDVIRKICERTKSSICKA